uniref:A kinase (PRKA) anchor protein 9 n=1 Tax=Kryptolebias marmoratus TaxID=37003 RepID=A0A3Q3AB85_KRYMA
RQQLVQYQQQLEEMNLEKCLDELESTKSELVSCKSEMESCRSQLEKEQMELESCKGELAASRQKERMSSNEVMQLMGTVEDLQKRCYQGNVSESDTIQKMQEDTARKLEVLRAELDEMYGQQIVQMKQEVNLQHAARVQQMTEQHQAEIELLKAKQISTGRAGEVEALTVRIKKLQDTLEQSQAMYDKAQHELNQVIQEKLKLQAKVEDLLRDLSAAKEEVEQVSTSLISQDSNQDELQRLQETIGTLRSELSVAQEAAQEAETKHESEITNYKIKLEMLEREKDAVLDRMAESQEAELERLRTQLLFSHEEELTNLREDLQRENFLNTENLLNEAAVRHQKALDELRISYSEQLDLLQIEKASFATERDELLHQILGLKEDLKLALHSPKADELVRQLQELQVELEELRKGAQEQAKMQEEIQSLMKKTEVLENQKKEKEHYWEEKLKEHKLEKETLIESNNTLGKELESKNMRIETLTAENNQIQQQVAELREEIEKQRTTFSFAEKNFEVNYQELKEEYTCLIEAKTQLEERTRRETLEFEAKIAHLQSQTRELEEGSRDIKMEEAKIEDKAVTEKDAKELMEKLDVTLSEKKSLAERLSEVTGQLNFTESKVGQLEDELVQVRQENLKVIADNESLRKKLEKKQEIKREQIGEKEAQKERQTVEPVCSLEDHRLQIQSLQKEIKALQSLLRAAEAERNSIRQTLELHRLSQTPSPAGEQVGASASLSVDLQRLKADAQEKQLQLEENHRQEMEHLRAHYQQQTAETEERYATELFLLQQRLQEATGEETYYSCQSSETGADNVSIWSGELEADEGLSQQMMDSLLLGAEPQLRNEEYFMGISSRLQAALEKMLMTITDTTNQLEHAQVTQTELMRESFRHNQEIGELLQRQEELQERLSEEAQSRERLALELHRAEGLIDGYTGERAALEEQLRHKEELQQSLEQELQVTGSRLHELEQERLQMLEERELLSRQQDAMREDAGPHLLEETEKLMKEKVDVQRQAEKENTDLLKQVKLLEAELEEQVNRVIELEHAQKMESGDLQQQIQALEKQLEKNRKFLDEQAVDREHERDFFQQEIQKLEQQLKSPQKLQIGSEQRNREVEQLTSQLKEKADWCSELLLSSEQLRRELGERDEEIEKLESRIRELEQALLASAESLEKVEPKNQHESITEPKHSTLEAQLQTEREALERKEKEICNLEEQLEQFREELENKSEEVQQLHMQLEIQRKEISSQQQYLETRDSMLQVNTQLAVMEEKDREIALLNEQITKLQHMETASDNKEFDEREEMIKDLESQVECLRSEQERLKRNKEEELEQLNDVIEKLQQELTNIEQKPAAEEEEDAKGELESCAWGPTKEEYSEMKQRMDRATKELETLRTEHSKLLDTYLRLKQSAEALAETENLYSSEGEHEDALREKTAALVVLQAEVQALEQSASSRVEELGLRIQELEDLVGEKDSEMNRCRLLVEQTQSCADELQRKVDNLEENLREKVAAALVSQATLEAFQQQSEETKQQQELERLHASHVFEFADFGIPQMDFSGMDQAKRSPTGKVVHLTQKLRDLEVGLSGVQRDQELQKQLLSSSEEEVLEYERRLAVLMDLLSQMKGGPCQRTSSSVEEVRTEPKRFSSLLIHLELEEVKRDATSTKEELANFRERNEKLQEDLQARESLIIKLEEELREVRRSVDTTKEELTRAKQPTAKGSSSKDKPSLSKRNSGPSSRSNSSSGQQHVAVTDSFTQTEPHQVTDLSPDDKSATKEEMEEVIGEFQEKIAQMQELHAAEILDMEARHISESENLRRDTQALEDECKAMKAVIDKLCSTEVRRNTFRCVNILFEKNNQIHPTTVSVWCLFNQTMLREVHQEGMQVLSLSELPLSEPGSQFNVEGWVKERDALLATVESLKGLITQMQTHGEAQVLEAELIGKLDSADWRAELLDAVQQVFLRERSVLKNALYSQLDLLDTSDAVVQLNQLERRLAEQDAHHREATGLLHTAERSSLISEVHQLRGQLEQLHQSKPAQKHLCFTKEQRERAETDGAAGADRLLVEELKVELSQTKVELETTLKAQHKHLKELDALRADVSQKAAELDALNDQLMEERKRSRDLQWAVEKEKCQSGRMEDSKREELEDLQLTLEEQKAHVAQLTQTLQQERQASSQLSQKAEQDNLSLCRRLQELQVQLETERAKALEMSSALGRERELRDREEEGSLQVEAQRLEVVRKEEELTLANQKSRRDEEALLEARAQLETLKTQMSEVQEQLEQELERRKSLEEEKERLEERLNQLGQEEEESRAPQVGSQSSVSLLPGGSSSSSNTLTERLLRQNAELTGFVSRLTEEKNDLRNHTLRLEEEHRRYRQAGLGSGDTLIVSQERESWTREKVRLEKALHLAQSQVARLRGEIRSETLREITGPEADNSALKRMYGKYLRSESFRKALIYQKKYLLLLLGGFQECEEATLSLLSRMGGRPSLSSLESYNQRRRGLMRFRSAVRVSIALSRMRFLVKRWHKATGMSSTGSCSVNKNGAGQMTGNKSSGGGGVSSSRGRSGRESPRSGISSSQFHVAADHGPLTCSHLQSYDPDRALTDYISRLEALQRRLGSVTSGRSEYHTLHSASLGKQELSDCSFLQ